MISIDEIEIKYLKSIIPNRLYNRLVELNIKNIADLRTLDLYDFKKMKRVGKDTILILEELLNKVTIKPNEIIELYNENCPKTTPTFSKPITQNVIHIFKEIIITYFQHKGAELEKNVIYKRYGINERKKFTLEEIGLFFDRTRERIRQIQEGSLSTIKEFLLSGFESKANLKIDPECQQFLLDFISQLALKKIVTKSYILNEISLSEKSKLSKEDDPFFELLMESQQSIPIVFNDELYYIFDSKYTKKLLENLFSKIISVLKEAVTPISEFELIVNIKKLVKSKKLQNDIVLYAAKSMHDINIVEKEGTNFYSLKFHKFTSSRDQAYLVLYDINKPIHYREIAREINQRLFRNNSTKRVATISLAGMLASDSRFSAVGKSGKWALSNWQNNTSTIYDLIVESLRSFNRPTEVSELFALMRTQRPDIRKGSVYTIINMNDKTIIRTTDNKYILKDWETAYKDIIDKDSLNHKHFRITNFSDKLVSFFNSDTSKVLSIQDILNIFLKDGDKIARSTLHVRLNNVEYLNKTIKGKKAYYNLKDDFKNILEQEKGKTQNPTSDLINNEIDIRFKEKRTIYLRDFVKAVSNKLNIPRPTIYKTISVRKDILKSNDIKGKISITLKDAKPNKIKMDEKLIHLIEQGENDNIEFKSSLRWDFKLKQINKELEFEVIKAIAAFLNSIGGQLFIGVDDDSDILGLKKDYNTISKKNKDGFQLQLLNVITNFLGKDFLKYIRITMPQIDDYEICSIAIDQSKRPVYIKKNGKELFFIRAAASSQSLSVQETVNYIKSHFNS